MTDTAPVTAWAVVDKDDKLILWTLRNTKDDAREECAVMNFETGDFPGAPHRVVRVEIKVVETGEG